MENSAELTLVLTRKCNLNCVYCYEHNKDFQAMDFSIAKYHIQKFLTNAKKSVTIYLFGGEPFLNFSLLKNICEWTWEQQWNVDYHFLVQTNGTLLNDEIKNWLILNNDRIKLCLSFDGTKDTHNLNRSNSYSLIDFDFFLKYYAEQPIKMTISDKNLDHLADDVIFIQQRGFKIRACNFAVGNNIRNFEDSLKVIAQQLQKLVDFYLQNPTYEIAPILNMPIHLCEEMQSIPKKRCAVGEDDMPFVDIDGESYPCAFFSKLTLTDSQYENVRKIDFRSLTDDDSICKKTCYLYPICDGCYGDNFISTGDIHQRSYQMCCLNRLRISATIYLFAHKIIKSSSKTITPIELKTIKAINKINQMFNN